MTAPDALGGPQIRVRIVDAEHPHYPETGWLTGEIVSLFGKPMAKMSLDSCRHGTDACFISKGQVAGIQDETKQRKRR